MLRRLSLFALLCTALAGCGLPLAESTPPPVIIVASATPGGGTGATAPAAPTAAAAPSATPVRLGLTAEASPAPAATSAPAEATAPAGATPAASQGTITFAFDAFPSYFPGLIAEVRGLLERRGYQLELVPFDLNGENSFSEAERFERLRSGEWDVLATTLDGFARQSDPALGAITAVIDESAGADKLVARPEIATLNDLRGRRIAYSEGSVGEFFLYYSLQLAGLTPADVTLVPAPSVADAVAAFAAGQADAVSAWEPDVLEAEAQGGAVLIASDRLRAILDVLVTSRNAIDTKADGVQAFHDAWFEALKLMTDRPAEAEQAIIEWGNPDWTGIAAPGDMAASLEKLAQATLGANLLAFRSTETLLSRIAQAQEIWRAAGQAPPAAEPASLVEGRFALASGAKPELISSSPPVNSSFLLTAQVDLPQLSEQEQQSAEAVVQLPLEKVDFEPDSLRLTRQAAQDLSEQVMPVLRSSTLYLKIDGSSAWPGPEGRFSAEEIRAFARDRANSVATFLVQQGINPNRLIIGTLDPQFPNSLDEAQLAQDRIVRFTLVAPAGR